MATTIRTPVPRDCGIDANVRTSVLEIGDSTSGLCCVCLDVILNMLYPLVCLCVSVVYLLFL